MGTNNLQSSIPALKPQLPVKTVLKSTAAKSAKLQLSNSYEKDEPSFNKDNVSGSSSKSILQNDKAAFSSTSYSKSKYTRRPEAETQDNPLSFSCSLMYGQSNQTSRWEDISVEDLNSSILAHDGSELSSDLSFNQLNGLQSQEVARLKSNRRPTKFKKLTQNNECGDTGIISERELPSTSAVSLNKTHLILAVSNDATDKMVHSVQDNRSSNNENSFELSFDTSRGHGAVCSTDLLKPSEVVSESHATKICYVDGTGSNVSTSSSESDLIIDLNYRGAEEVEEETETGSATNTIPQDPTSNNGIAFSTATASLNPTAAADLATVTETGTEINICNTNSIDMDLTNVALARRGNPENLYGLLAGFITTGKRSKNPITINLHQCYNCDGTCVRNTIKISSPSNALKVTNNGIENLRTTGGFQHDLTYKTSSNVHTTAINVVDPQGQFNESNLATQHNSDELAEHSAAFNSDVVRMQQNIIKPASFLPYNKIPSQIASSSKPAEIEKLLSIPLPSASQSQTIKINGTNKNSNSTFIVSGSTELDSSNVHGKCVDSAHTENNTFVVRNSTFQEQLPIQDEEQEHYFSAVVDSEISPITKPGLDSNSRDSFIPKLRIQTNSISKRKRGAKRSTKRRLLKTKAKKSKLECTSKLSSPALASTSIQSRRTQAHAKTPERLVDSEAESLTRPIFSPDIADTPRPRSRPRIVRTLECDGEDVATSSTSSNSQYTDLFTSTAKTCKNQKMATLEYSCKKCEFRTMSSVTVDRKLKDHFKKHKKPSQFRCIYCCKEFSAISSRKRHIETCRRNPSYMRLQLQQRKGNNIQHGKME